MAHHNTHQRHVEISITRPLLLRIISILTLVLPAIFYLLSMSFTLATIFNKSFAVSYPWQVEQGPIFNISYNASPFFRCTGTSDKAIANFQGFNETCSRLGKDALGSRGLQACHSDYRNAQLCSQRVLAAEVIVAGAVLSGIAVLGAIAALGFGWSQAIAATTTMSAAGSSAESTGLISEAKDGLTSTTTDTSNATVSTTSILSPLLTSFTTLLALIAAVLLIVGQVIGYNALVVLQAPKLYDDSEDSQTRWILGKAGQLYMTLAYSFAALGILVVVTKLGVRGR